MPFIASMVLPEGRELGGGAGAARESTREGILNLNCSANGMRSRAVLQCGDLAALNKDTTHGERRGEPR